MLYIIIGILSLAIIIAISTIYGKYKKSSEMDYFEPESKTCGADGFCCGVHSVCEKNLPRAKKEIIYFDDEELDRLSGKNSDDYSIEEVDEFKEIISSIRKEEMKIWLESLRQRNIELPKSLIV